MNQADASNNLGFEAIRRNRLPNLAKWNTHILAAFLHM